MGYVDRVLRALIRKEARLAVRSRRVYAVAAGMSALSCVAALVGGAEHEARVELHQALTDYGSASFGKQKADHPHSIAHNGYVVSRPPAPLGFLDGGVESAYGRYLRLDAHQTRPLAGAATAELSRGPGAGRFDLGLLLAVFAPAMIVLLGFDQIAREKTRGTWAMMRAAGVRAAPLVTSKLCGTCVRVAIGVLTPAVAVALVAGATFGALGPRIGIWIGAHVVAAGLWCALVLATSALARTEEGALLGGIGLWAVLSLGLPPFAGGLARAVAPVRPPGDAIVKAAAWADSAHAATEKLREEAIRDIRLRHPRWDGTGDPPEVVDAVMLRLADAEASKRMFDLIGEMDREADRQERLAALFSTLSPSGLTSLASSAIAGSDLAHLRESFRHYERYRVELMAWFNDWWAKQGDSGFTAFDQAPRPAAMYLGVGFAAGRAALPGALILSTLAVALALLALIVRAQLGSLG